MIEMFTDGACRGNPGPGGWGVVMLDGDAAHEISGSEALTTNNRMELMAAIEGLRQVNPGTAVSVHTDSQYVKNGIQSWVSNWKANGWRTASKQPVKNKDLWLQLDALSRDREVQWHWVKGHSGHPQNERADARANRAIDQMIG
ncbi:MAG: ribonuclease HI [Arenicellales bacterium]